MKKITFILFTAALVSLTSINVFAQGQSRQVSGFNSVATSGPFNVYIKINGNESVRVDADADLINEIETVVEDNTLKIRFKDRHSHHNNFHKADIYVEAKSLESLTNSGSGGMKVEGTLTGGDCRIVLSGSGNISTQLKSSNLNAVISGSGSIKLSGSTGDANFTISGSGEIEGGGLKASNVMATISGSGNIHIQADKALSGHISGSGNIIYSGNASVMESHTSGSGRITKD
jgi:hypothetical protein